MTTKAYYDPENSINLQDLKTPVVITARNVVTLQRRISAKITTPRNPELSSCAACNIEVAKKDQIQQKKKKKKLDFHYILRSVFVAGKI